MDFGKALSCLKAGARIYRTGWNGKRMFLFLVNGSTFKVNRPPLLGIYPEGTEINYHAHIDMKTATGEVVPWVASQSDLLAEDWEIVEVIRAFEKNGTEIDPSTGEPLETGGHDIDRDGPPAFSR